MLRDVQNHFMAAVLATSRETAGSSTLNIHGGSIAPDRRIGIYRRNVMVTLRGALSDIFSTTKSILGDDVFLSAADHYIVQNQSTSGDLNQFGRMFPAFLRQDYAQTSTEKTCAVDMATLDWAWHEAFHAADYAPLDLARLGAVPSEQHTGLMFRLHPSVCLLESVYPLIPIWQSHQLEQVSISDQNTLPDAFAARPASVTYLVVHRDDVDVTLKNSFDEIFGG